jgi:hypothetical protein
MNSHYHKEKTWQSIPPRQKTQQRQGRERHPNAATTGNHNHNEVEEDPFTYFPDLKPLAMTMTPPTTPRIILLAGLPVRKGPNSHMWLVFCALRRYSLLTHNPYILSPLFLLFYETKL